MAILRLKYSKNRIHSLRKGYWVIYGNTTNKSQEVYKNAMMQDQQPPGNAMQSRTNIGEKRSTARCGV